jgi:excisionase family DNA binding protein
MTLKAAYTVGDAAERLSISKTLAYDLIKAGELRAIRVASVLRVPATAIDEFLERRTQAVR